MSETNYFRLIEAYFEGSISSEEKVLLEAKVESDPLVKAEFDLQRNIINGISESRKLELKSRLAAVDLPTATGILSGGGVKWLAGTLTGVTLFGSILYWSLSTFDNEIKPIDLQFPDAITFLDDQKVKIPTIQIEDVPVQKLSQEQENLTDKTDSEESQKIPQEEKELTAKVKPQALMSYEDDKLFTNEEEKLDRISSKEIAHNRVDKTEVEFLEAVNERNSYHYRYYNSKLYLYGDFKKMPYQIIELNDQGKKQLFLSHNDEVYIIRDNTTEITELKKVEDNMLKMEIQLIVEE